MKIGAIIQARLDSERLCHKVLKQIDVQRSWGVSRDIILSCVLWAAKGAKRVDEVAVTSPDRAICMIAHMFGVVRYEYHGPRDPLAEYHDVASGRSYDPVVRLTADCPMLTSAIIDAAIQQFLSARVDYLYNGLDGADVEVFTFDALDRAYRYAQGEEREHVGLWIRRNLLSKVLDPPPEEKSRYKSLDTPEDYRYICELMGKRETA